MNGRSRPRNDETYVPALMPEDLSSNTNPTNRVHQSQDVEKPDDDGYNDNDIQDILYLAIHWNVAIDKPQQHSNNNQNNDE